MSPQDREKWTDGMEVPVMREKGSAEYLYWLVAQGHTMIEEKTSPAL